MLVIRFDNWRKMVPALALSALALALIGSITAGWLVYGKADDEGNTRSSASVAERTKPPIKIGVVLSLSGVGAPLGHEAINGLTLYLDQIKYEMSGREVKLIIENDESSPVTAIAKVKKLVEQDNVDVLNGISVSHIALALIPSIEKYQVPTIAIAGSDDITQRRRSKWLIRLGFGGSQPMHPFGDYAYKKLGFRQVATLSNDFPYGWEVVGGFQRSFEEDGGKVVQKIWAPLGFMDFTSTMARLRKDVDAVLMCAGGQAGEIMPKQYYESGIKLPLLGTGPGFDDSQLPGNGPYLLGSLSVRSYVSNLDTPANKHFLKSYRAKFGHDPGSPASTAYSSGKWIDKAVKALKGDIADKDRFMHALMKVELADDPRGPIKVDSFGGVLQNIYVRKVELKNGKPAFTIVESFPMVSQFWKWKPEDYLKQPSYSREFPPCRYCAAIQK